MYRHPNVCPYMSVSPNWECMAISYLNAQPVIPVKRTCIATRAFKNKEYRGCPVFKVRISTTDFTFSIFHFPLFHYIELAPPSRSKTNSSHDSTVVSCTCAGAGAVIALIFSVSSGYSPHGNPIQELSWSISAQAMHVSGETTNNSAAIIFIIFFFVAPNHEFHEFSYIFMTTIWVACDMLWYVSPTSKFLHYRWQPTRVDCDLTSL